VNLTTFLETHAHLQSDNPAIYHGRTLHSTYADLRNNVARLANATASLYGVKRGDRVGLFMQNCPAFIEVLLACWWNGAIAVPINNKLHPGEAQYILNHSGADLCFSTSDHALEIGKIVEASDLAPTIIDVDSDNYTRMLQAS